MREPSAYAGGMACRTSDISVVLLYAGSSVAQAA